MKHVINIYEAKTHLSRLVDEAGQGADIVIARAGKPVARLCRIQPKARKRKLGILDGRFKIPDDFNAPLPDDVLAAFTGTD
jgi:prevent-host-death family protein